MLSVERMQEIMAEVSLGRPPSVDHTHEERDFRQRVTLDVEDVHAVPQETPVVSHRTAALQHAAKS